MRYIYHRAASVVVWLGERTRDIYFGLDAIAKIYLILSEDNGKKQRVEIAQRLTNEIPSQWWYDLGRLFMQPWYELFFCQTWLSLTHT